MNFTDGEAKVREVKTHARALQYVHAAGLH